MITKLKGMFKPKCWTCGKRADLDSESQCNNCYREYLQWKKGWEIR